MQIKLRVQVVKSHSRNEEQWWLETKEDKV